MSRAELDLSKPREQFAKGLLEFEDGLQHNATGA
jgi:hypothetical protein